MHPSIIPVLARIRNSWHRRLMLGMGRDCGMPSDSPSWRKRKSVPASILAAAENGGDLMSSCRRTSGFLMTPLPSCLAYIGSGISSRPRRQCLG